MVTAIAIVAIVCITGIGIAVPIAVNSTNRLAALVAAVAAHAAARPASDLPPKPRDLDLYRAAGIDLPMRTPKFGAESNAP